MMTLRLSLRILCICISLASINNLISQNAAMHFDGIDDYIDVTPNPLNSYDFTIEGWYYSETTVANNQITCTGTGPALWYIGNNASSYLLLGECNGQLYVYWQNGNSSQHFQTGLAGDIRGGWHHIAFTMMPNASNTSILDFELRLDCDPPILMGSVSQWDINASFVIGQRGNQNGSKHSFLGKMDDIKVYNKHQQAIDLCTNKRCIVDDPKQAGLLVYYRFDEGIPGGVNRNRTAVQDYSGNGNDGDLNNFFLRLNTSNYIQSTSPIFTPLDLVYCPLITSLPFSQDTLTQICNSDAVHLCLSDTAGLPIAVIPPDLEELNWVYSSNNGPWQLVDTILQDLLCGAVSPNIISIDCATSSLGYEDWDFRGEFKFKSAPDSCYHYTKSIPLRVCCGLDSLMIQGTTNQTPDLLCDMDTVDFTMSLLPSYPFLTNPASGVTIDWTYNGTPLPQFANQVTFNYNNIIIDINTGACFQAKVDFPICDKKETIDLCFPIDPRPICGTIDTLMMPTAMRQISASPKVYEICPGDDAALKIDDPFMNCIPTWQYSYGGSTPWIWHAMGTTNSQQNTNIIPTTSWPGTNIFYRIECNPINDPSGCKPCYSDTLEIRLSSPLTPGTITGTMQICSGTTTTLTHQGHDPTLTNQWYCNGIPVGNGGPTLPASMTGCYWVESTDGCSNISTNRKCVEVCEVVAVISCPDVCPRPGIPITLSACPSFDSCGLPLTYQWSVTGANTPTINGCDVTHIPDASGSTYSVTVTNSIGCTDVASTTIVPCAQ